jgi:hypothetical protein
MALEEIMKHYKLFTNYLIEKKINVTQDKQLMDFNGVFRNKRNMKKRSDRGFCLKTKTLIEE